MVRLRAQRPRTWLPRALAPATRPPRRTDRWRAKYELLHVVRTHMGQDDAHYGCVYQKEDSDGKAGVHLSKDLMRIAGHALKANITTLGPLVLPISEQLLFFANLVARKVRAVHPPAVVLRSSSCGSPAWLMIRQPHHAAQTTWP